MLTLDDYIAIGLGLFGVILLIVVVVYFFILDDGYDNDDDYDDDDYDDDDYDDNDDYDDEEEEKVVKILHPADYNTGDISYPDMMLRLTRPHLYSDQWYDEVRRDFSRWAVTQYREIAAFRSEVYAA